jgi:hypothetical protein
MTITQKLPASIPIACDLTAIPLAAREQHITEGLQIFRVAQEVQELSNGYAFRFANEPGMFMALANFVENERRCCAFYEFVLEVKPGHGPLWLRLTGGEGVKEFEQAVFSDANEALRQQFINTGPDGYLNEAVAQSAATLAEVIGKASSMTDGQG